MIVITGRKRFYGACTVSRNQCRHILTNKDLKQKLPNWRKRGFNISSVVCVRVQRRSTQPLALPSAPSWQKRGVNISSVVLSVCVQRRYHPTPCPTISTHTMPGSNRHLHSFLAFWNVCRKLVPQNPMPFLPHCVPMLLEIGTPTNQCNQPYQRPQCRKDNHPSNPWIRICFQRIFCKPTRIDCPACVDANVFEKVGVCAAVQCE